MRVAILSHTYVEPENRKKLHAIAHCGVSLTAYVPARWREGELGREWRTEHLDLGVTVVPVSTRRFLPTPTPTPTPAAVWWDLEILRDRLRCGEFDLLHIEEEPWSLAAWGATRLARKSGIPTAIFTWQNLRGHPPWPVSYIGRRTLSRANGWVAGNTAAQTLLREIDPGRPLVVLPQLGIDSVDQPLAPDRAGGPLRIGFVGRLVPEKGVADLIAAAARLRTEWQLVIVGSGPDRGRLEQATREAGIHPRVQFRGAVPHDAVHHIWRDLDVLVLPSRTTRRWAEQFGHVLIEAMAAGVPVVGSDSGAIPEVIGEAGIVFPEGESEQLADALTELTRPERRARNRTAGLSRAREFTHEMIAERLIRFWRRVIDERTARER